MSKTCSGCFLDLPEDQFQKKTGHGNRELTSQCKACLRLAKKESYKRHKQKYIDAASRTRKRAADYIRSLKEDRPCADCGEKFPPCAMDFDHVRGTKSSNVGRIKTLSKVDIEIEKCDLVCANCHRLRTYLRKHGIDPLDLPKGNAVVSTSSQ